MDEEKIEALISDGDSADPNESVEVNAELKRLRSIGYVDYSPEPTTANRSGVNKFDPARSYPGYNLYTIRALCRTELIDAQGHVVHFWQHPEGGGWVRSVLLENGDLLVVGAKLPERYILRLHWNNKVLWKRRLPVHHDVRIMPDGRFATLGMRNRLIPDIHPGAVVRDDYVVIFSEESDDLEAHSLHDMLASRPELYTFENVELRGNLVDLVHANSLRWMTNRDLEKRDPLYSIGNIIVCMRHQNAVAVFDLHRASLVWAWGHGELQGPHDASVLENGNFLIFDNGVQRGWSRVIEVDPLRRQVVWTYSAAEPKDFYTAARGAAQRLPNGNTLITESNKGRGFEVSPEGEIVWDYSVPHVNDSGRRTTIIRLYRYERDLVERLMTLHDSENVE